MAFEIKIADVKDGVSPFREFILSLDTKAKNGNKQAKALLKKIYFIMERVEEMGTRAGSPWTDHLDNEIWEMRPMRYRILFSIDSNDVLILTYFMKKTQQTPPREIERAKTVLKNWHEQKG